jgi:glucose 1-dehydrogenase/3-oxoacyl-[acyl-carrier protein] reductase
MEFKDKKVIVTGANRSIGRKIAQNFAEQGADLVIKYQSKYY